jgi:hypothetical protein
MTTQVPTTITEPLESAIEILKRLTGVRFSLHDEKALQEELEKVLRSSFDVSREHQLSPKDRVDFFFNGVAVELKIKGGRKEIYKQCVRYCSSDQVKALILITNRAQGFPPSISGKPCYLFNLGKAWL